MPSTTAFAFLSLVCLLSAIGIPILTGYYLFCLVDQAPNYALHECTAFLTTSISRHLYRLCHLGEGFITAARGLLHFTVTCADTVSSIKRRAQWLIEIIHQALTWALGRNTAFAIEICIAAPPALSFFWLASWLVQLLVTLARAGTWAFWFVGGLVRFLITIFWR